MSRVLYSRGRALNVTGRALSVPIIDSFEDQDLSEWTSDTADFSIVNSPVARGSWALDSGQSGSQQGIVSDSGLPNYPARGDIWRYEFQPINGGEFCRHDFLGADNSNEYRLVNDVQNGELIIREVDGGTDSKLAEDTSVSWELGAYNTIEIDTSDTATDTIAARAFNSSGTQIGSVSVSDGTHSGTQIGILHNGFNSTDRSLWDFFRIIG